MKSVLGNLYLLVAGAMLSGCYGQPGETVYDDESTAVSQALQFRAHMPVCRSVGARMEGWYWQDTGKLIRWDNCKDADLTCKNVGEANESFVRADNSAVIAASRKCGRILHVAGNAKPCSDRTACAEGLICKTPQRSSTGVCRPLGWCDSSNECKELVAPGGHGFMHEQCIEHKCVRPVICTADAKECPGGVFVSRDPEHDCEFPSCPKPPQCGPQDCGPALGMMNYPCPDGVTIAGPGACERQENGQCGWTIVSCPPVTPSVVLTELQNGSSVTVELNDSIRVELKDSSASTGYSWVVSSVPANLDMPNREPTIIPSTSGRIGAPGTAVFNLTVKEAGAGALTFQQVRTWETNPVPAQTLTFRIRALPLAHEGEMCVSIAGVVAKCAPGLECKFVAYDYSTCQR